MATMKLTAILILAAWTAAAQGGRGAPPIKSPEVSADGKVTFRLRAPNAKEVVRHRHRTRASPSK